MYSKILIANRGEIAVRIIRACKEMGINTVAVYSEVDAESLHVALADESVCIGKAEAADSYLNESRIISAALVSGAQAIHPGYGFLSENAGFAELCRKNNVAFIGPSVESMKALSDKAEVKRVMAEAGLPTIPGSGILETAGEAAVAAEKIGYPVMLKARSGGGGRGIRLVSAKEEMAPAFLAARAEGAAAFGDNAVYMEKYVHPARHIEIQILADEIGNVVCLGERDCSIQRKNQKLIEESPSPAINEKQRADIFGKVIHAVKQIGYTGVGTLEFLYDRDGNFYFMEINVRLQVEHTVTESLTGRDLVKWQIRVSSGVELDFSQEDIDLRGSSIECRINARAPGKVEFLHIAGGPFVRFDTYLTAGAQVTPYYDPLLGKLIIYAGSREEALRKMKAALCELVIDGVPNNIEEQIEIVGSDDFMSGKYNLDFFNK
ncbi:MAG: acetyl/propionyl/methylcrotonyl-CoA carboxylase subunit alpha [Oscillospiraceae bacterium]